MNNKVTYQPLQKITVRAEEKLPAFRFVAHDGTICATGAKSLGVVEKDWLEATYASIITLGTVPIETTETVLAGNPVTCSTEGKAKVAGTGDEINGRAIESCSGKGFVKIILVP